MKTYKEQDNDLLNKIQKDNKVKKNALKKIINALDKKTIKSYNHLN